MMVCKGAQNQKWTNEGLLEDGADFSRLHEAIRLNPNDASAFRRPGQRLLQSKGDFNTHG